MDGTLKWEIFATQRQCDVIKKTKLLSFPLQPQHSTMIDELIAIIKTNKNTHTQTRSFCVLKCTSLPNLLVIFVTRCFSSSRFRQREQQMSNVMCVLRSRYNWRGSSQRLGKTNKISIKRYSDARSGGLKKKHKMIRINISPSHKSPPLTQHTGVITHTHTHTNEGT